MGRFENEASKPAMLVNRGTVRENVPTDITDAPSQCWVRAMYLLFVNHLLQEIGTCLLVAVLGSNANAFENVAFKCTVVSFSLIGTCI